MYSSRSLSNKITMVLMVIFLFSTVSAQAAPVYDYYPNGRIKSITYVPPENGISYIEYLDEEWGWLGHGRTYREVRDVPDVYNAISYEYAYTRRVPIISGTIDAGAQNDLVIDLGGSGLYKCMNGSSWTQISTSAPEDLAIGDVDNDGLDDIVVDFGSTGLYKYTNNSTWAQISSTSPESIITGDVDNDGLDDVIADFGTSGIYKYTNNSTWTQISSGNPESLIIVDLDNDGLDDIVADFGPTGLYKYTGDSTWTWMTGTSPEAMMSGDFDGDGLGDVLVDFGAAGLFQYTDNSTWSKISNSSPEQIVVVGDMDNDGLDDIVADWGSAGLYKYTNNSTWEQISTRSPESLVAGDIDNNGLDDIVVDFGSTGLYKYTNNSTWAQISSGNPESITAVDTGNDGFVDIIADFGSTGLYVYTNNSTWSQMTSASQANTIIETGYENTDYTGRVMEREIDLNGNVQETRTYYPNVNNYLESKTLAIPDAGGNIYYHYYDEDFGGQGYGRIDVSQLAVANANGEIAFEYSDFYLAPDNDQYQYKYAYTDVGRLSLYGTYEYAADGSLIGFTPANGEYYTVNPFMVLRERNATTGEIQEYLNEDWAGNGKGRVTLYYDNNTGNEQHQTYTWDDVNDQVTVDEYSGVYSPVLDSAVHSDLDVTERTDTYLYDHNLEYINLDPSTNGAWIIRQHTVYDTDGTTMLEDYIYDAQGRMTSQDQVAADRYYTYTYHPAPDETQVQTEEIYERSTMTLLQTITYRTDGSIDTITGNVGIETYPVTSNVLRQTLATGEIYEYTDEDIDPNVNWDAGKLALAFELDAATSEWIYKTWDWGNTGDVTDTGGFGDTAPAGTEVLITTYEGLYAPVLGDPVADAVNVSERRETILYEINNGVVDPGQSATWLEKEKVIYHTDGRLICEDCRDAM